MTDRALSGHSAVMPTADAARGRISDPADDSGVRARPQSFESVYDQYFDFVWRSVRRLGVRECAVDDVVQDTFVVVHRRLGEFEGRSTLRTWLFGIALRVAQQHRRRLARKGADELPESIPDTRTASPAEAAERAEAVRLLHALLDCLPDERRTVFILAELEQLPAPEIAEALDVNVNTIYSRLRLARRDFDRALRRHRARDEGGRL